MINSIRLSIFFICLYHSTNAVRYGYEVGSTSMDSTHYDRRLFHQNCPMGNPLKELQRTSFWAAAPRSLVSNSNITSNSTPLMPFSRQLSLNNGDERLIKRSPPATNNSTRLSSLGIDQATVDIVVENQIIGNLTVYIQVIECLACPYEIVAQDLSSSQLLNLTLNTKYSYRIQIELNNNSFCSEMLILNEHGHYLINVQASTNHTVDSKIQCNVKVERITNNVYTPLIVGSLILVVLFISSILGQRMKLREQLIKMKNRCFNSVPPQESTHSYDLQNCQTPTNICQTSAETNNVSPDCLPNGTKIPPIHKVSHVIVPRSKRLLSLDTFRGLAVFLMIFVNYGGGGYAIFEYSAWHGITVADIVFPIFVWILGASMVFSLKNSLDKGVSKRSLLIKIALRTLKLFLIGFVLNTRFKVDLNTFRVLGVLQRLSIVYGVIATIEVLCTRSRQYSGNSSINNNKHQANLPNGNNTNGRTQRVTAIFRDITNFPLQWLLIIGLTTIWLLVIYLVPFNDCPAGYLGPGGLHDNGKYENCTGGITSYIDRMILGDQHLYQYPSCQLVYGCKTAFDPENLLGTIPTIFLAYLGVQAGRILVMYPSDLDRLIRLFAWSALNTGIGIGLTGGTIEGGPMPINRNLWTLSFSFLTAGLAFAAFTLFYIAIEKFQWWNGTPLQYLGTNAILIYMSHLIFASYFPIQWHVTHSHAAHLAMAIWGCTCWIFVAYIFFKKRVFLVL